LLLMGAMKLVRRSKARNASAAYFALLVSVAMPVHAQASPDPGAIERTIPQIQQSTVVPNILTPRRASPTRARIKRRFTLGSVNIDGATVFSNDQLSPYFEPYLASQVDEAKLAEMAARITDRYRHAGYLLSYAAVPAQAVEAGMVRLAVSEGRIDTVTIEGAGPDQAALEAITEPLLSDAPLRGSTLERAIGLIRDFPGLKVTDVSLSRSDMRAGLYALKIRVTRDRERAFAYMDNRGTGGIGHSRFYTSGSFSSLLMNGDELRVDLFAMPGGHSRYLYGQLHASAPIGRNGLRVAVAASKGDQSLISTEPFAGDSRNLLAQLSYPVLRSRALTMVAKLSMNDWLSSGEVNGTRRLRDRMRVLRFGLEVSREAKTRLQGDFTLSRGLGFDGATRAGDPLASRRDASGRFIKAAFTLQARHPLSDKVRLQATLAGQYSNRPLLSAEEFSLGGSRIGRAFAFNALTGDRGIGGGLELSYRIGKSKGTISGLELFGFADGGVVFEARSPSVVDRRRSLASVGAGSRFSLAGTVFSVEAGVPVAATGHEKSLRLFFSTYRAF
jgi:hemolysin activation/secretion protein